MKEVKRSALVPYTAEQMFALVEDIERYPQFLPWVAPRSCWSARPSEVIGRLEMHRAGMREIIHHSQRADRRTGKSLLTLVDGPVQDARRPLDVRADRRGSRHAASALSIRFEFANPMLNLLLSRSFEKSCSELVDAFVARARAVYGTK